MDEEYKTLGTTAQEKLAQCQTDLTRWCKQKFGNVEKMLKKKTKELQAMQRNEGPETIEATKQLQREIRVSYGAGRCQVEAKGKT
jgi:hypothetical protein